jgi:hypothetical protein
LPVFDLRSELENEHLRQASSVQKSKIQNQGSKIQSLPRRSSAKDATAARRP